MLVRHFRWSSPLEKAAVGGGQSGFRCGGGVVKGVMLVWHGGITKGLCRGVVASLRGCC